MSIQPFVPVDLALKEVIEAIYAPASGKTGGDLAYVPGEEIYVLVAVVPGSGTTDETSGEWAVDIEVFGNRYTTQDKKGAMDHALALEALLLPGRHRAPVAGLRIDNVYQNSAPGDLPWDDESTFHVGATYVVTARRSG